jgi:hypothetical protein
MYPGSAPRLATSSLEMRPFLRSWLEAPAAVAMSLKVFSTPGGAQGGKGGGGGGGRRCGILGVCEGVQGGGRRAGQWVVRRCQGSMRGQQGHQVAQHTLCS